MATKQLSCALAARNSLSCCFLSSSADVRDREVIELPVELRSGGTSDEYLSFLSSEGHKDYYEDAGLLWTQKEEDTCEAASGLRRPSALCAAPVLLCTSVCSANTVDFLFGS